MRLNKRDNYLDKHRTLLVLEHIFRVIKNFNCFLTNGKKVFTYPYVHRHNFA